MPIMVESMSLPEARELLGSLVEPNLIENEGGTRKLLDVLEYLRLAVAQAGAYITGNQLSSTEYLEVFNAAQDDTDNFLDQGFEAHGRYTPAHNSFAATFIISFDQLQRSNQLAAEYLKLVSLLNEKDVPYAILPPAGEKIETIEAIGRLKAFAFIQQRHDDSFDMHRLVQISVRHWVTANGDWEDVFRMALRRLNDVLPPPEYQSRDMWARYLPHVLSVLELRKDPTDPTLTRLMSNTGTWLTKTGKYGEAAALFKESLERRTYTLGSDDTDTLSAMKNYAAILFRQGMFQEAMQLLTHALKTAQRTFVPDHPFILSCMNNLASTYERLGRLEESIVIQKEVLDLRQRILGPEHPETLVTMNNYGNGLIQQGKTEEARAMFARVLDARKVNLGPDHPDVLSSMNNLALTLESIGRGEEATIMQREVLDKRQRILGNELPNTLSAMNNLASSLFQQGNLEVAMEMSREALEKERKVLGDSHPDIIATMNNFALILKGLGKLEEAEEMQKEILEMRQRILGKEHPHVGLTPRDLISARMGPSRIEQEVEVKGETNDLAVQSRISGEKRRNEELRKET